MWKDGGGRLINEGRFINVDYYSEKGGAVLINWDKRSGSEMRALTNWDLRSKERSERP